MLSHFSHVQLCASFWTVACQAPLSVGFSRQKYWSGLPCPLSGYLPHPGIKTMSLMSPALAGRFFTTSATWEALASWKYSLSSFLLSFLPSFLFLSFFPFSLSQTLSFLLPSVSLACLLSEIHWCKVVWYYYFLGSLFTMDKETFHWNEGTSFIIVPVLWSLNRAWSQDFPFLSKSKSIHVELMYV